MRRLDVRSLREERAATAIEFALVAPLFVLGVIAVFQLGILFLANAGLNNAMAEGARFATLYPRPSEAAIRQRILRSSFGIDADRLTVPSIRYGVANSSPYAEIQLRYSFDVGLAFLLSRTFTLEQSRRVYLQPEPT